MMASPAPFTLSPSFGVRTRQKPEPSAASMSMASSGVSAVTIEVSRTTEGPARLSAATAALASVSVATGRPVRNSSSNWFGVTRSAMGTALSRMNSGMPGRTKTPRPTSPITGSQA